TARQASPALDVHHRMLRYLTPEERGSEYRGFCWSARATVIRIRLEPSMPGRPAVGRRLRRPQLEGPEDVSSQVAVYARLRPSRVYRSSLGSPRHGRALEVSLP